MGIANSLRLKGKGAGNRVLSGVPLQKEKVSKGIRDFHEGVLLGIEITGVASA